VAHGKLQTILNYDTCLKLTKNADFILLRFADMLGYLKDREIPVEQANRLDRSNSVGKTETPVRVTDGLNRKPNTSS
jgi:glutamine synthetase